MYMQTMMHTITLQPLRCEAAQVVCTEWGELRRQRSGTPTHTAQVTAAAQYQSHSVVLMVRKLGSVIDLTLTPPHTHPLLHPIPGDHAHLRCKVCHVFLLLLQSSLGHKNGEVAVSDSKLLDLSVHKLCSDKERHWRQ